MDPTTTYASVTTDDMTVESNTESAEAMTANFAGVTAEDATTERPAAADQVAVANADEAAQAKPATDDAAAESAKPAVDKRTKEGRKAAIQAEIDALTKTKYDTQREIDAAKAEVARLRAEAAPKPAPGTESKAPAKPATDPEPAPDQFDTYEKYVKAQAKWEARQELQAWRTQDQQERERREAAHLEQTEQAAWRDKLAAARARIPNFDARLKADVPMSTPLQDLVKSSDVYAELLLHFSDHPDDAQRLSTLHPIQLIRALGRLEERVAAAPPVKTGSAPAPVPSHAKAPITPVGASPIVTESDEESDDEPVEKFFARENARERKAGRR